MLLRSAARAPWRLAGVSMTAAWARLRGLSSDNLGTLYTAHQRCCKAGKPPPRRPGGRNTMTAAVGGRGTRGTPPIAAKCVDSVHQRQARLVGRVSVARAAGAAPVGAPPPAMGPHRGPTAAVLTPLPGAGGQRGRGRAVACATRRGSGRALYAGRGLGHPSVLRTRGQRCSIPIPRAPREWGPRRRQAEHARGGGGCGVSMSGLNTQNTRDAPWGTPTLRTGHWGTVAPRRVSHRPSPMHRRAIQVASTAVGAWWLQRRRRRVPNVFNKNVELTTLSL